MKAGLPANAPSIPDRLVLLLPQSPLHVCWAVSFHRWVSDRSLVRGFSGGWVNSPRCPAHLFGTVCLLLGLQVECCACGVLDGKGWARTRARALAGRLVPAPLLVSWPVPRPTLPSGSDLTPPGSLVSICVLEDDKPRALLTSAHALSVVRGSAPEAFILLPKDWGLLPPQPASLQLGAHDFLDSLLFSGCPQEWGRGQELCHTALSTRFFCFCSWHMQCKVDFLFLFRCSWYFFF